jgi:vacuolar-type H+-ATPase subunit H
MPKATFKINQVKISTENLGDFEGVIEVEIEHKDADPLTLQKIVDEVPKELKKHKKPTDFTKKIDNLDSAISSAVDSGLYENNLIKSLTDSWQKMSQALVDAHIAETTKKAQEATEKIIADNKKASKDTTKSKFKVGAKLTLKGLSLGKSIASLVVTMGADISAYFKIVKTIKGIVEIIKKNSETLDDKALEILEALNELKLAEAQSEDVQNRVSKTNVKKIEEAVSQYETTLARLQDRAAKMSVMLNKLLEKDSGKEAKTIDQLI